MRKKVLKQAANIKKNALIGAGTVCTTEQCREMVDLGADFIVSSKRIAATGGVWMFQGEGDHTVVSEEEIITRINHSIDIAKQYKAKIL